MKVMFPESQVKTSIFRRIFAAGWAFRLSGTALALGIGISVANAGVGTPDAGLVVLQEQAGQRQELQRYSLTQLGGLRATSSRERDRSGGDARVWKGPLLGDVLESSMKGLTVEQRAQFDLVVLSSRTGQSALVPRSFLSKYPMLLALSQDGKSLAGATGPIYSVPPWTSREGKMTKEGLPVQAFFVPGVSEVILTSYQTRFGEFILQRRTDPAAMRGQKIFVQTCATCHGAGLGPTLASLTSAPFLTKARTLASGGHPVVAGFEKPSAKDERALNRYFDARNAEKPSKTP